MTHRRTEFPHDPDRDYIDALTELEVREVAHQIARCRDCGVRVLPSAPLNDGTLDKFGRCEDCAEDIARRVAAAETANGWDPYP